MILKDAIRAVQSENDRAQWYMSITNAALYIAIGGFINEANRLLEGLWKHKIRHDRTTWLPDIAFEMLWYASDKRPANVPFAKAGIGELEISHRDYLIQPLWTSQSWLINETDTFTKGMVLAATKDGKLPDSKTELEALYYFQLYFEDTSERHPYQVCQSLSLAAELACRNGKEKFAIDLLKKWASRFKKYPYDNAVVLIGCNRHVAPLLLKGIIADELDLTMEICSAFVDEAIMAIDTRMKDGSSLVYGNLTWFKLLKKLSLLSIKYDPEMFSEGQKKNGWIGREPAKSGAIKETEKRLGLKLPKEYKDFLKQSNGFAETSSTHPELLPIEEVNFLKIAYDGNEEIFDITKSYPDKNFISEDKSIAEYVDRAISISRITEQEVWLIPPVGKDTEWQCWFFAAWLPGEERFKNFRYYIEEKIQRLESD
jgi:hypothetical protein